MPEGLGTRIRAKFPRLKRATEAGPVIGLTTRDGAIIERVRTGTPARWASNRENPLALLECGG